MIYEVCIVSKEFRWVDIEAPTEESACEQVMNMLDAGYVGDTDPEDCSTELLIEGVQR